MFRTLKFVSFLFQQYKPIFALPNPNSVKMNSLLVKDILYTTHLHSKYFAIRQGVSLIFFIIFSSFLNGQIHTIGDVEFYIEEDIELVFDSLIVEQTSQVQTSVLGGALLIDLENYINAEVIAFESLETLMPKEKTFVKERIETNRTTETPKVVRKKEIQSVKTKPDVLFELMSFPGSTSLSLAHIYELKSPSPTHYKVDLGDVTNIDSPYFNIEIDSCYYQVSSHYLRLNNRTFNVRPPPKFIS